MVGGAVRDALLGREVSEVDLAATLAPLLVTDALEKAGFKVKPTGLAHGTVTAAHNGIGYEITTLRHDVETDGRHAKVAFTDDWQADATRRDFTINAIYADESGKLYDYHHGREDLAAGRVRFIGDARQRIQEDVLRILRFFRFSAWFATRDIDSEGLSACRELAPLMTHLSIERVARELLKLLAAANPLPVWRCMASAEIASPVLPEAAMDLGRLEGLIYLEKRFSGASVFPSSFALPLGLLRLAALLPSDSKICEAVAQRLKLSNRDAACLATLGKLPQILADEHLSRESFRRAMHYHGKEVALASALLAFAEHTRLSTAFSHVVDEAHSWQPAVFPVRGKDLSRLGIAEGPKMGDLLRRLEAWWVEQDFRPTRDECLAQAANMSPDL